MLRHSSRETIWRKLPLRAVLVKNGILSPLQQHFQHYYSCLCNFRCSNVSCHIQNFLHMPTLPSVSCYEKSHCGELQDSIHTTLLKTVHTKGNCNFRSQRQSRARHDGGRTQQICFSSVFKARKKLMCFIYQQYAQMLLTPSFSFQSTLFLIKQTIYIMLVSPCL